MGEVAGEGRTVLFVSHNMQSILSLCQRALHLDSGKIHGDGDVNSIIRDYLNSETQGLSQKVWEDINKAPGTNTTRLRSIRVCSEGKTIEQLDSHQSAEIEIEFWNLQPKAKKVVQIKLLDSNGVVVLESFNTPEASDNSDPLALKPLEAGLYRSTCIIPPNFLNDKQYFISVLVASFNPTIAEVNLREVVSFSVNDSGAMRTPGLSGKWFGLIRTPLNWESEFLKELPSDFHY